MLDDHARHTAIDGAEGALDLGQHTLVDHPFGAECGEALAVDGGDHAQVIVHVGQHAILHEAEEYLLSKMPIMPIVYNQNYYLVDEIGGLDFDGYGNPVFTYARLKADISTEADLKKDEED